jgi:hypothetical protein
MAIYFIILILFTSGKTAEFLVSTSFAENGWIDNCSPLNYLSFNLDFREYCSLGFR